MTHADLVERATIWLAGSQRCNIVLAELSTLATFECPDVIGWKRSRSILVECKASRGDFNADKSKKFRSNPSLGMGVLRYFMAPADVLRPDDVPENWGLLVPRQHIVKVLKQASPLQPNRQAEISLLVSAMLKQAGKGSFYVGPIVIQRPYLKEWRPVQTNMLAP